MTLEERLAAYLATARAIPFDPDAAPARAGELLEVALRAGPEALAATLDALADDIGRDSPTLPSSALLAGALVERGGPVAGVAAALLPKLGAWVERSVSALELVLASQPAPEREDDLGDDGDLAWVDAQLLADPTQPHWHLLHELRAPCAALLGASPEWRHRLASLLPALTVLEPYHEGAAWLRRLLAVLDDEPVVVLHVAERRGYRCRMSGIASNFDLFVLLVDALGGDTAEGWLDVPAPPPEAIACLCGGGPQNPGVNVECPWNVYTFEGLAEDRTLPEPGDYSAAPSWVWGDGEPCEIPPFEGTRVLLLGPPSYPRMIGVERTFSTLRASLQAEQLSGSDTAAYIERVARRGSLRPPRSG